jgi:hypothetical protein
VFSQYSVPSCLALGETLYPVKVSKGFIGLFKNKLSIDLFKLTVGGVGNVLLHDDNKKTTNKNI